jgi:hypothetical protein
VQYFAVASQKFTCPTVTAAPPAVTVAVSVTTVFDVTDVTALPPLVTASVVAVVAGPAHATAVSIAAQVSPPASRTARPGRNRNLTTPEFRFISGEKVERIAPPDSNARGVEHYQGLLRGSFDRLQQRKREGFKPDHHSKPAHATERTKVSSIQPGTLNSPYIP